MKCNNKLAELNKIEDDMEELRGNGLIDGYSCQNLACSICHAALDL